MRDTSPRMVEGEIVFFPLPQYGFGGNSKLFSRAFVGLCYYVSIYMLSKYSQLSAGFLILSFYS